jgi:hypothetical protein
VENSTFGINPKMQDLQLKLVNFAIDLAFWYKRLRGANNARCCSAMAYIFTPEKRLQVMSLVRCIACRSSFHSRAIPCECHLAKWGRNDNLNQKAT